jgi:hypothetical protein
MAGWLAAYGALVAAAAGLAVLRPGATLWRGPGVLIFNALFVGIAAGAALVVAGAPRAVPAAAAGALLLASWALRSRWLVVGADDASVGAVIESSARRMCAPCERVDGGYRLLLPDELRVRLRPVGARSTLLTFDVAPRHRKAKLFRRLLAKQYHGALPTLRIPIR